MSFWKTLKDQKRDVDVSSLSSEGSNLSEADVAIRVSSAPKVSGISKQRCVVPEGVRFQGVLYFDSPVSIGGDVKGSILSSSTVIVEAGAKVKANIKARSLQVSGFVAGDIEVIDKLVLHPNAEINGKLKAGTLEVYNKAVINAECSVYKDKSCLRAIRDVGKDSLFAKNAA